MSKPYKYIDIARKRLLNVCWKLRFSVPSTNLSSIFEQFKWRKATNIMFWALFAFCCAINLSKNKDNKSILQWNTQNIFGKEQPRVSFTQVKTLRQNKFIYKIRATHNFFKLQVSKEFHWTELSDGRVLYVLKQFKWPTW